MKLPEFLSPKFKYLEEAQGVLGALKIFNSKPLKARAEFFVECTDYKSWLTGEGAELMTALLNEFTLLWRQNELPDYLARQISLAAQSRYNYLNEEMLLDFQFLVEGTPFPVNSMIVAMQSKVIATWLLKQSWNVGQIMQMEIDNLSKMLFKHVHEYLMQGTAKDLWKESPEMLMEVIFFANQHGIDGLAESAAKTYVKYLTIDNVEQTLKFSQQEYLSSLERACCSFINEQNYGLKLIYKEGLGLEVSLSYFTEEGRPLLSHLSREIAYLHFEGYAAQEEETLKLLEKVRHLVGLNFEGSSGIAEDFLDNFPSVSELIFTGCSWLEDAHFLKIAKKVPRLSKLDISGVENLTYESFAKMQGMSRITRLNLSQCGQIGDEELDLICRSCPVLTELNLSFLNFSDTGLLAVGNNCSELTTLDLSNCRGFSGGGLLEFASKTSHIESIILDGCAHVDTEHLMHSLKLWPQLKHISTRGLKILPDLQNQLDICNNI